MKFNDITNCVIEEIEAASFINVVVGFGDIKQIKNGSQNLVHSLDILYPRV